MQVLHERTCIAYGGLLCWSLAMKSLITRKQEDLKWVEIKILMECSSTLLIRLKNLIAKQHPTSYSTMMPLPLLGLK